MTSADPSCCAEYTGLSRRGFLRGAVGVAAGAGVVASFGTTFMETSYAAAGKAPRVLVVLSMRGAADGLSLVVPHADPVYYQARKRIAVPSEMLLGRDGMFGLHPSLAPLMPWWDSNKMAAIHAVGLPSPNRSHFAAMEAVEDADPGSSARTGWLNRLVGRHGSVEAIQTIQFGGGVPTTAVTGPHPVLATNNVDGVRLAGAWDKDTEKARRAAMQTIWGDATGPLGAGARSALDVVADFEAVRGSSEAPANGATYRDGNLGDALASAARAIKADVGAEIITVDHGSWDHHEWVGTPDSGNLKNMAGEFAGNLAAFLTDLGPMANRVTVVTISEFGRRVVENANAGLDHGHGTVMFAVGAGVNGGRYFGRWPGLQLGSDADLPVTTDYRSVLAEVVTTRLGASSASVFPGFQPESIGMLNTL